MDTSDFDYYLPENLIAQTPKEPRDHSRLLVLDKVSGKIWHKHFYDIVSYLKKGDVIVLNDTKVFPARLMGKKEKTLGQVEVFLHRNLSDLKWECLIGGKNVKVGLRINFPENLYCEVLKNNENGVWELEFNLGYKKLMQLLDEIGEVPLPPYIKMRDMQHLVRGMQDDKFDKEQASSDESEGEPGINHGKRYQTVYANERKIGSVAAPTAGLHFTPELIESLKKKGVRFEYITLHVGMGTFAPVKVDDIRKHKMHSEWVEISKEAIKRIFKAKKQGRKVLAVGTTSTRSLEAMALKQTAYGPGFFAHENECDVADFRENVDIFIYPGFEFKVVDAVITNFHLPKSTLLMLVSAFAGKENIDKAYEAAIAKSYRFFSYGDAMLMF